MLLGFFFAKCKLNCCFVGDLRHVILPDVRHTGVTFFSERIYAVTNYMVFPNGAVFVYEKLGEKWQRIQVIYLPANCAHNQFMSIQISNRTIYVCNMGNNIAYVYSLSGELTQSHTGRTGSYLCALDSSGLLEARINTTTMSILTKGSWQNGIITGLNRNIKGAVIFERKLYVACFHESTGFLQLYSIE